MTRIEKAKELHPDIDFFRTMEAFCPESILPIGRVECPSSEKGIKTCYKCWNQEYKEESKA